jgi:hypothetical protein
MAQAPVSPSPRNNSTDELCERVWGRGTLPEAVGGKVGLRNDGANGNLAGHISSRRQYLKANRYVARSADTAEGTTSAIETACRGDRGAASRIRTPMAAATALPLSFAARHVRRVVERPRGNGGQRREREQNRQARSHKAPSPAKVLVHSKHPLGGSIARSQRTQRPFRGAPGAPGSTRRTGAPEQPGGAPGATAEHPGARGAPRSTGARGAPRNVSAPTCPIGKMATAGESDPRVCRRSLSPPPHARGDPRYNKERIGAFRKRWRGIRAESLRRAAVFESRSGSV